MSEIRKLNIVIIKNKAELLILNPTTYYNLHIT